MMLFTLFLSLTAVITILPSLTASTISVNEEGIYLFGGDTDPDWSTSVYRINPDDRRIDTFNMSSQYRGRMQAGALANGTIVFSFWNGPFNGYGLYNPSTNQVISTMPNIPNIQFREASLVVTGPYLVNCGYNGTSGVSPCVIYNTLNGGLKIADVMETKYYGCAVPFGDNRHILWIGGYHSDSVIKLDTETGTFSQVAAMPQSRESHSCALHCDVVVICGGWPPYDGISTSSCITLTLPSMTWGTFPSMTTPRRHFQLVNWKCQVLAIGGWNGYPLPSIELYEGHKWSLLNITLPQPLTSFGAGVVETP